jgi:hypothetical protein
MYSNSTTSSTTYCNKQSVCVGRIPISFSHMYSFILKYQCRTTTHNAAFPDVELSEYTESADQEILFHGKFQHILLQLKINIVGIIILPLWMS